MRLRFDVSVSRFLSLLLEIDRETPIHFDGIIKGAGVFELAYN